MSQENENAYTNNTILELIELLILFRKEKYEFDPKGYDELLVHLKTRDLTLEQKILIQKILHNDIYYLSTKKFNEYKNDVFSYNFNRLYQKKYLTLRGLSKIMSFIAYGMALYIVYTFLFTIASNESYIITPIEIVIACSSPIFLLTIAKLVMVLIDIEENTRINRYL
jgi:hypothetical protein